MEIYRLVTVHDANGSIAKKNTSKEAVDPSPSSFEGKPRFSSWLSPIQNSLDSLMRSTGTYPAEVVEAHLAFMRDVVVPRLKPPAAADRVHYIGTHSNSCYDASLAFETHKSPKVRFSAQPIVYPSAPQGGDPFGQKEMREIMEGIASACGADRTWLDIFLDSIFFTVEEEAEMIRKWAVDAAPGAAGRLLRQSGFVSFDFEPEMEEDGRAATLMKAYLFPQLKALAKGQNTLDTTDYVVSRLAEGDKEMLAAWELVKKFLSTDGRENINLDFLAIDCLAPHKEPRFKVYITTPYTSLAAVREVFTLGGLLHQSSADFLTHVWPQLMDMEDILQAEMEELETPLRDPDSHWEGVSFTFSMVPGKAVPLIKMYMPMWQLPRDEAQILEAYQRILQSQGILGDYDLKAAVQGAL
ncbi:aromatic prenyltransferase [Colletotrichum eremochloae]|nr:aromatic prenyltransferase [Colletotrichum eremochloae]